MGIIYWLFDTTVDFINPTSGKQTFLEILLPTWFGVECIFRSSMAVVCMFGTKFLERTLHRVHKLEQQLFLNEFAVEHTKAFAMLWSNAEGRIIKVNEYAADRLGYSKAELLKKTVFDITVGHDTKVWEQLLTKLKKDGNLTYAAQQRKKDGTLIDAVVYLQYLKIKADQYQFAFVCDAFHCPVPSHCPEKSACGRPSIPSLAQVLNG